MKVQRTIVLGSLVLATLGGTTTAASARSSPAAPTAAAAVTNGRIALVRAGNIWTVTAKGTGGIQLTKGGHAGKPRYSPDGQRLAFVRTGADGRDRLWIMRQDGAGASQASSLTGVGRPDWSPDGKYVAFVADDKPDASGYDDSYQAVYRLWATAPYSTPAKLFVESWNDMQGPHDPTNVLAAYAAGTFVSSRALTWSP